VATLTAVQTPASGGATAVTVTAEDLEFDTAFIRVKAGASLTVTFRNNDTGVAHNLGFSAFSTKHETCTGPCTTVQTFTAATAGQYSFFCNIHDTMFGAFIVE
jgi:plastocyanin